MKINPDSTVLQQVDGHWQKIAALILWKTSGKNVVRITLDDMKKFNDEYSADGAVIFTHGMSDGLEFSIVTESKAIVLAAHDAKMRGKA